MNKRAFSYVVIALGVWLGGANSALAYPQYIAHGSANCASCHYSPDGGGLANAYGAAVAQALFPDDVEVELMHSMRETLEKVMVTGENDEGESALQWDFGLDMRFLLVEAVVDIGAEKEPYFIPMLLELQQVLAWGDWLFYGSVTPKKTGNSKRRMELLSREHWLQWRYSDEVSIRLGRLTLPFGTRTPDHTAFVRRRLGMDKYDQSYGLKLDWNSEYWAASAMAFAGDSPWRNWGSQEKGASATAAYLIPSRGAFGVSALYGQTRFQDRLAAGVFTRVTAFDKTYLLLEFDYQRKSTKLASQDELVAYGRLGWFARDWLDLYGEFQRVHILDHPGNAAKPPHEMRFNIGANMQILTWVELIPAVQITPLDSRTDVAAMAQLHLVY